MDGRYLAVKNSVNANGYYLDNRSGFTLVELMISLVISGIITAAIYTAYISQQQTHYAQEQVAAMQQNIRAGMDILTREIRMAGYDPSTRSGAEFTVMQPGQMSFSADLNGDGDTSDSNETVDIGFRVADDVLRDGIPDTANTTPSLGIQYSGAGGYQPAADNIQALEFRYLDSTGGVAAAPADIRAVQVSILARADQPDRNFTNTSTYNAASGNLLGQFNDNFRRRLLITTIQCRNMGL